MSEVEQKKKRGGIGKTKPCNICICQSCAELPEFDVLAEFREHLQAIHGIDLKTTPFERTMLLHMDADKWYESQYQWTEQKENGIRFQQLVRQMRKKGDYL